MVPWEQRTIETATLFNPAFCSILLTESSSNYKIVLKQAMPYSLSFLVLPLILNSITRKNLPKTTAKYMRTWLSDYPEFLIDFPERVRSFVPFTKEALIFGLKEGTLQIDKEGKLLGIKKRNFITGSNSTDEVIECIKSASFLGRWLAKTGSESDIFRVWRITP